MLPSLEENESRETKKVGVKKDEEEESTGKGNSRVEVERNVAPIKSVP
jgi:hypothetical protein